MATLVTKIYTGMVTRGTDGSRVLRPLAAAAVKSADGNTLEQHVLNADIHTDVAVLESTMDTKVTTAVNVLKDGADGSSLAAKHDTLAKISTDIDAVRNIIETFLSGEADGLPIDKLIELVTAIGDNEASIDSLLNSKIDKTSIVNNLLSEDATGVLSAAQGKILKDQLDQLASDTAGAIAALHTHANMAILDGIGQSAVTGGLTFNSQDYGLLWQIEMSQAAVEALTEWPATLHPNGMILMEASV